jgi:hypothetical protein
MAHYPILVQRKYPKKSGPPGERVFFSPGRPGCPMRKNTVTAAMERESILILAVNIAQILEFAKTNPARLAGDYFFSPGLPGRPMRTGQFRSFRRAGAWTPAARAGRWSGHNFSFGC